METDALLTFKSHIDGKNADVAVYPDRIEWTQERSRLSIGKGKASTQMIPVRTISSIGTKRDGLRFTNINVITTGATITMRVGHGQAKDIVEEIHKLLLA